MEIAIAIEIDGVVRGELKRELRVIFEMRGWNVVIFKSTILSEHDFMEGDNEGMKHSIFLNYKKKTSLNFFTNSPKSVGTGKGTTTPFFFLTN
jgi:hypothetical protein